MGKYGIPYQGNKSKIADDIIFALPSGKRLVDLFGGGGAITHCAVLSGKWESVYYNDINPLLPELLQKAINGFYNYDRFTPEFITREKFFEMKDKDGYIKYIWSFGNDGRTYMFGKEIEEFKHSAHDWVVFNKKDDTINKLFGDVELTKNNIHDRRIEYSKLFNSRNERLEQLERLERISFNCHSYTEYKYCEGDVVYCDIPYEQNNKGKCNDYKMDNDFDNLAFYEWAKTRDFPIYFSSYDISDTDFECVWEKDVVSTLSPRSNNVKRTEKLYVNKHGGINKQMSFL